METTPLFIESLDFNFGLFHQGPNGAVITYFSPDPAPWPSNWTRWLLSKGRVEAGGDFNFGLFHQGPNGAVITYFSLDPAHWPTDWTLWLLSQGRVEAAVVFKNSGGNINMDLKRWLLSSQGTTATAGAGFQECRGKYSHGTWEIRFEAAICHRTVDAAVRGQY